MLTFKHYYAIYCTACLNFIKQLLFYSKVYVIFSKDVLHHIFHSGTSCGCNIFEKLLFVLPAVLHNL